MQLGLTEISRQERLGGQHSYASNRGNEFSPSTVALLKHREEFVFAPNNSRALSAHDAMATLSAPLNAATLLRSASSSRRPLRTLPRLPLKRNARQIGFGQQCLQTSERAGRVSEAPAPSRRAPWTIETAVTWRRNQSGPKPFSASGLATERREGR